MTDRIFDLLQLERAKDSRVGVRGQGHVVEMKGRRRRSHG